MSDKIKVNGNDLNNAATHYFGVSKKLNGFSGDVKHAAANLQIQHSDSLANFRSSLSQMASEIDDLSTKYAACTSCVNEINQIYQNAEGKIFAKITGKKADEDDFFGIPGYDYSYIHKVVGTGKKLEPFLRSAYEWFSHTKDSDLLKLKDVAPWLSPAIIGLDIANAGMQLIQGHKDAALKDLVMAGKDTAKYILIGTTASIGATIGVGLVVDLAFKSFENIAEDVSKGEDAKHVVFDATVGAVAGVADDVVGKGLKFFFPNTYYKVKEGYTKFRANVLGDSVKAEQNKPAVHATSAIYGAA